MNKKLISIIVISVILVASIIIFYMIQEKSTTENIVKDNQEEEVVIEEAVPFDVEELKLFEPNGNMVVTGKNLEQTETGDLIGFVSFDGEVPMSGELEFSTKDDENGTVVRFIPNNKTIKRLPHDSSGEQVTSIYIENQNLAVDLYKKEEDSVKADVILTNYILEYSEAGVTANATIVPSQEQIEEMGKKMVEQRKENK